MNKIFRERARHYVQGLDAPVRLKTRYKIYRIKFYFLWYDCWIGFYYDKAYKTLYIQLLPMIGIQILLIRTTTVR